MPSASVYLGPRTPRLEVESWDDVVIAAAAGVLDENHWVELEGAVPPSSEPADQSRRETSPPSRGRR